MVNFDELSGNFHKKLLNHKTKWIAHLDKAKKRDLEEAMDFVKVSGELQDIAMDTQLELEDAIRLAEDIVEHEHLDDNCGPPWEHPAPQAPPSGIEEAMDDLTNEDIDDAINDIIRTFDTGANRDLDTSKPDYEGIYSPLVMEAFGEYMSFNTHLKDGTTRESDNWQKGMPLSVYMKSGWRHFYDWWRYHRGHTIREGIVWACCGLMFNLQGYLHELLKKDPDMLSDAVYMAKDRRGDFDQTHNLMR